MKTLTLMKTADFVTKPATFVVNHVLYVTPTNNANSPKCILALDDGSLHIIEDTYENVAGLLKDTLGT